MKTEIIKTVNAYMSPKLYTFGNNFFLINELVNYASYGTAKKILQRMEKNGEIVRVIDGIYSKPKFSKLLNKNVPSSIPDVANKIAEKFAWNIIPSGDIALNMLHLSTQVPACYEYLSNGPYREYEIYGMKLKFKHTTNRLLGGMSSKSALVIQAFKTLGEENITSNVLQTLKEVLTDDEKKALLDECKRIPALLSLSSLVRAEFLTRKSVMGKLLFLPAHIEMKVFLIILLQHRIISKSIKAQNLYQFFTN